MIYGVSRNKGKGIGYTESKQVKDVHNLVKSKPTACSVCVKKVQTMR